MQFLKQPVGVSVLGSNGSQREGYPVKTPLPAVGQQALLNYNISILNLLACDVCKIWKIATHSLLNSE